MAKAKSKKDIKERYYYAIGRRKSAVATVRLYEGSEESLINSKKVDLIYTRPFHKKRLSSPFEYTDTEGKYYFHAKTSGGGIEGQLDAIVLALSRALVESDASLRKLLKKGNLLTRDSRAKERKKPGLKKARKKEQYSKR